MTLIGITRIKKYKLNHEEDPHSEFADRHNGRYILDLVIKVNKLSCFQSGSTQFN